MASYKTMIKKIALMQSKLGKTSPEHLLADIFKMTTAVVLKDREKNRKNCQIYRAKHRKEYNERHKLWQREYYQRKKGAK